MRNYLIRLLPRVADVETLSLLVFHSIRCLACPGTESGASKVRVAFPLVDPLPSTDSAAAYVPALFARFSGTMESSDSLETCMSDVRPKAFSDRPPQDFCWGVSRVSRFPRREFPRMHRVFDSRGVEWRLAMDVASHVAFPI